jgi:RNA polymerase sigma-70 factor (ECF subfamily)
MEDEAFELAVVEIAARLPGYFRSRVSDAAIVDDLTQETLVKAFRSQAALRNGARLEAWVYRIAHCTVADYYRRRCTTDPLCDDLPYDEAKPPHDDVRDAIVSSARCYLETLPKMYREPVYLAEHENFAHADIARTLGLSLAATKSRVRRGKLMVRNLMEARCRFEYDRLGNVIGYQLRFPGCVGSVT